MRFLSPLLLEDIELKHLDVDEFLTLLAQARYVEDLEMNLLTRAIGAALHGW